jgi:DMSO/TMAO reductase YedYZ molybdopterin-dependent catalytic subunit
VPDAVSTSEDISVDELRLAGRNHAMPLEALRHDVTPPGLHYLLIHFDIPDVDARSFRLTVDGAVRRPLSLSLDDLRARTAATHAVTLECAGNGRAHLSPRPLSQPWLDEAVGTAEWTGTSLAAVLAEAGIADSVVEVLLAGADRGVQGGAEQQYERSLPLDDALRPEVLLAWAMNGRPLPPQHGFPLRAIVPGWYGMTHVKWLERITLLEEPFAGYQQISSYRITTDEEDLGVPVTKMLPRSLLIPPGIPDFASRTRFLRPSRCELRGRAWSGHGPVVGVEVSTDGGSTWAEAELAPPVGPHAWRAWRWWWDATEPGEHVLCSRATDAAGNVQPLEPRWNLQGMSSNAVQRVRVVVEPATSG